MSTEVGQSVGVEKTEVTSTPAVETSAASAVSTEKSAAPQAEVAKAAESPWAPNFKYKAGGEEKEFDPFVQGIIKDADTEAKIRDLYTKAHGLEPLKGRLTSELDTWKKKYEETAPIAEKYANLTESLQTLNHYVKNENFDKFFESLDIPLPKVWGWMQKKLKEQDMPPEQRQELAQMREYQDRMYALEKQNQDLLSRFEETSLQQKSQILDQALMAPEVKSQAEAFDSRVGQPGAFRQEVIKRGLLLYQIHGRDLSPEEVVQDFLGTYGKVLASQTQSAAPSSTQAPAKAPVIPNIASKGSSPVRTVPKSIADLKNLAASL